MNLKPTSIAELCSVLAGERMPAQKVTSFDLSAVNRLVEHKAEDMTATVGAGLVFPLMKGAAFVPFWYVYALLWLGVGLAIIPSSAAAARSASR